MTKEQAHTAWTGDFRNIVDGDGLIVAQASSLEARNRIVLAVNCHDELVSAIKDARSMLSMVEIVDGEDGDPWSKALARMDAVLVRAK